ncbi:ABC transporter substrate-binding protein [Actinomadura fibrosa]|uniref:ABC transporter substrate-binding protein n=1 Tax=Actinomadura fibrosa TaxID=111802 RepID=A0ABW2XT37_9ACTN|nr:ABC transporter substrate-binding protein [Actinomadura fibrosa]
MTRLSLSFACEDYDRIRALRDGRVVPEGIDLNVVALPVEETFYRQARYREFDVSEMSLSTYLLTLDRPSPPFVALPVFPSRSFRHQSVYVNTAAGLTGPADLRGRRVGLPEYQLTACVWQRGILAEHYGVPVESVRYFTGGLSQPGRIEKIGLDLPPKISVTPIGPDQTLSAMLAEGELDAVYCPGTPAGFGTDPRLGRLFPDFQAEERDYYRRTGIFPIMHTVVIRREVYERHPWIARSLTKAFIQALDLAYTDLAQRNALKVMLPWLEQHLAETLEALGAGYWDYGLERNRHVLETFARYSAEQGLAARPRTAEEIVLAQADDGFRL